MHHEGYLRIMIVYNSYRLLSRKKRKTTKTLELNVLKRVSKVIINFDHRHHIIVFVNIISLSLILSLSLIVYVSKYSWNCFGTKMSFSAACLNVYNRSKESSIVHSSEITSMCEYGNSSVNIPMIFLTLRFSLSLIK